MTIKETSSGLRARKRAALEKKLVNAAIDLYLERGYRETRIDDIARAADVSRRTFFHYFAAKEDVMSEWFAHQGEFLREAFLARPADEPVWDALRESFRVLFVTYGVNEQRAQDLRRLIYTEPALFSKKYDFYLRAAEALIPAVQRRLGRSAANRFTASVLVRAALAAHDAAAETWALAGGRGKRYTQMVKAFALARPAIVDELSS